jgi:hypothetical protein
MRKVELMLRLESDVERPLSSPQTFEGLTSTLAHLIWENPSVSGKKQTADSVDYLSVSSPQLLANALGDPMAGDRIAGSSRGEAKLHGARTEARIYLT